MPRLPQSCGIGPGRKPDAPAYTFIDYELDPAGYSQTLTWSELYGRVQALAAEIAPSGRTGRPCGHPRAAGPGIRRRVLRRVGGRVRRGAAARAAVRRPRRACLCGPARLRAHGAPDDVGGRRRRRRVRPRASRQASGGDRGRQPRPRRARRTSRRRPPRGPKPPCCSTPPALRVRLRPSWSPTRTSWPTSSRWRRLLRGRGSGSTDGHHAGVVAAGLPRHGSAARHHRCADDGPALGADEPDGVSAAACPMGAAAGPQHPRLHRSAELRLRAGCAPDHRRRHGRARPVRTCTPSCPAASGYTRRRSGVSSTGSRRSTSRPAR